MPLLQARGLSLHFGERILFQDLDLSVDDGEQLLVQGPSGAGKSTLLRALAGLIPLDGGTLLLGGQSLDELGAPTWRSRVAWLDQSAPALADSPARLVEELQQLQVQRERRWLDAAELAAELGLDAATWSRSWQKLSGGERQRAHLAIALASKPQVLLLDEPTSALDERSRDAVEAALRGRTAVWVSHDAGQVRRIGGRLLQLGEAA